MLLGSIEAGGTKFICSVGDEKLTILDQIRIETTTPKSTLSKVIKYFKQFKNINSISIASFGPLDLDLNSSHFGSILKTPKLIWENVNILKKIKESLNVPVFITTDVNGSAVGEQFLLQQSEIKVSSLVYLTIGTGIGAGIIYNNHIFGLGEHPEIGHIRVVKHSDDKSFHGVCPFHDGCLEGMASGPSLKARTNIPGEQLSMNSPIWNRIAYYLAQSVVSINLIIHPKKIILGGSVVNDQLIKNIKKQYVDLISDYVDTTNLNDLITKSCAVDNNSATIGNFILAKRFVNV
ncbi:ROK family protein [Nicoliella lavandulae]|uniref:fructokinase n=1 Tax=Nicoliella lavandulae TaxID=3082954 RepID=A0ABU8SL35_9LACO